MFSPEIAAVIASRVVSAAYLVQFDFRDLTKRVWLGFGPLRAGGQEWQGLGELISIEGLEQSTGTAAAATTFTLSGVDRDIVAMAAASSDRVKGRIVRVYLQFFETTESAKRNATIQVGALLGGSTVAWSGWLDQTTYAAEGTGLRTITQTAEGLLAERNRPPFGMYTPGDQAARFPGDKGLDHTPGLESYTVRWPDT